MCGLMISPMYWKNKEEKNTLSHRGPDQINHLKTNYFEMDFYRLAIMDLSPLGMQPFESEKNLALCNGEIYNFESLQKELANFIPKSHSDCEFLVHYFEHFGAEKLVQNLDGEYALIIASKNSSEIFAARDPLGVRPLFYIEEKGDIAFASEVKALMHLEGTIKAFPPGHYYFQKKFIPYFHLFKEKNYTYQKPNLDAVFKNIHDLLYNAVEKRLHADAPLGFLLSGGVDSSLVCAIAAKVLKKPLETFSVGLSVDPIDLKYAKIVANHIGSNHCEIIFTTEQAINHVPELIKQLETFDITTIRASIGMSLVCKEIKSKTNVKALLTGEVSDELFGYKYTDFAPNAREFQEESLKRVRELYFYDILRADRCIALHSLEARVPFSDKQFVEYVLSLDPELKMNTYNMGKYLLRKSFDHSSYLPHEILYRDKAAFSDAVGHSMVDELKKHAEQKYSDEELKKAQEKYSHCPPISKESLWYREIFESFYPGKSYLIPSFWMPNQKWNNCNVNDPSARVLANYGKSGE